MYQKIAIVGVGTLGGFLAKSISDLEGVKELVLIDYDSVERKNLKNHIYEKIDVGKLKVDALYRIIKRSRKDIRISRIKEKFIENETKIPKCDLVIDCRDFTYDRGELIDVRSYISGRHLIIDCRKNISFKKHHEGIYVSEVTKLDLQNVSIGFSTILNSGLLTKLISTRMVEKIFIDKLTDDITKSIQSLEVQGDLILEKEVSDKKLSNVHKIKSIFDENKNNDITLFVGEQKNPVLSKVIPKGNFSNMNDLLRYLHDTVNIPDIYQNYIICPVKIDNKFCVQLIPETGAA